MIFVTLSLPVNAELSVEEIIKGRKALFSKNYSTDKRGQTLTSLIEDTESVDEVRAVLTKMMWGNCKACHSKFRAPH